MSGASHDSLETSASAGPRWALGLWSSLAQPQLLAWLGGGALLGIGLGVYGRVGGFEALSAWRASGPLEAQIFDFFHLYDPLRSGWLAAAAGAALLSLVGLLWERQGVIARWIGRAEERALEVVRDEGLRAWVDALGEQGLQARWPGHLSVLRPRRATTWGLGLMLAGGALLLGAWALERAQGLSGEILLRPLQPVDRAQVAAAGGLEGRGLGTRVELIEAAGDVATLRWGGEHLRLERGKDLELEGARYTLRALRPIEGASRGRLKFIPSGGEAQTQALVPNEVASLPGGESVQLLALSPNHLGFGPAAQLQVDWGEGEPEQLWVFERYPGFDRANRPGPLAFDLLEIEPAHEAIVGVVRHPGLPWALAGLGLLIVGAMLYLLSLRGLHVLLLSGEGARGLPAGDPQISRALKAL